jgi:hypothetical protein
MAIAVEKDTGEMDAAGKDAVETDVVEEEVFGKDVVEEDAVEEDAGRRRVRASVQTAPPSIPRAFSRMPSR